MFKEDEDQKLKFTINDSNIQGQGIFPVKNIKKDEFIGYAYQIIGEIGKLNEDTEYIIGQETLLGNMHNHSYEPTAEPKFENKVVSFYALKDLTTEDEITCDYNRFNCIANIERVQPEWK
jgi:SET domain-containing protein|tara:strand:+ start:27974 stop:28333 length:360 start_codon:yes stop_codon:yes gene_type:complete